MSGARLVTACEMLLRWRAVRSGVKDGHKRPQWDGETEDPGYVDVIAPNGNNYKQSAVDLKKASKGQDPTST